MIARRRRDAAPGGAPPPPAEALAGCWVNTASSTRGLARLDIAAQTDGRLTITSFDAGGGRLRWRPETTAVFADHPASSITTGFVAETEAAGRRGRLQGCLNLGLLVLALYREPADGGAGYFSREFFLRVDPPPPEPATSTPATGLFPTIPDGVEASSTAFGGRWLNTDPGSAGIVEIAIEIDAGGPPRVLASGAAPQSGAPPTTLGSGPGGLYATVDEVGQATACLLAAFELGDLTTHLELRLAGGALVLANFNRFHEGDGRRDYFTREFYRRARPDG